MESPSNASLISSQQQQAQVSASTTAAVGTQKAPFQNTKMPQNTASWSQLKTSTTSSSVSGETLTATSSTTSKPVDSFTKYKMQLLEQKQKEQQQKQQQQNPPLVTTSFSDEIPKRSSPPPLPISSATNPISPPSLTTTTTSDLDSNSQMSPPVASPPPPPPLNPPSQATDQDSELKRSMSIQEMREKARKKREEIANKMTDMSEQHQLMAQFEQNLMPPS